MNESTLHLYIKRGHDVKLIGIKSLDCNFNPIKKIYQFTLSFDSFE